MSAKLEALEKSGDIVSHSFSEAYVPIRDLTGAMSKRVSHTHVLMIVYIADGKKQTTEFDGTTKECVIKQAIEFVNGLKK